MLNKQQRPVRDSGQTGTEAPAEAPLLMFVRDLVLDLLPFDAERRIGDTLVEGLTGVAILGERIAEGDTSRIAALDEQVGLTNGEALGVQFLAKGNQPG